MGAARTRRVAERVHAERLPPRDLAARWTGILGGVGPEHEGARRVRGSVHRGTMMLSRSLASEVSTMRIALRAPAFIAAAMLPAFAAPPDANRPSDSAAPPFRITEYQIPRPGAFPHDPAAGADGTVWYTDQANSYIGRLDPATGKITDYPTPTPKSGPHGIVVAPDGMVWYTGNANGRIGKLDPKTRKITEYVLPAEARDPHTPAIQGGKVWFTAQQSNLIGVLDPATGATELYRPRAPRA